MAANALAPHVTRSSAAVALTIWHIVNATAADDLVTWGASYGITRTLASTGKDLHHPNVVNWFKIQLNVNVSSKQFSINMNHISEMGHMEWHPTFKELIQCKDVCPKNVTQSTGLMSSIRTQGDIACYPTVKYKCSPSLWKLMLFNK